MYRLHDVSSCELSRGFDLLQCACSGLIDRGCRNSGLKLHESVEGTRWLWKPSDSLRNVIEI